MKKVYIILSFLVIAGLGVFFIYAEKDDLENNLVSEIENTQDTERDSTRNDNSSTEKISDQNQTDLHPMAIERFSQMEYEGGNFNIEEKLPNGSNYERYIASYLSEGLKIYGLLTVPLSEKPENGYPAILFLHGYIPPERYSTVNDYPTYQASLARAGFVTFKPDLRGHGNSEGEPESAHFSEKYVIDSMYALSYLQNHEDVDQEKIGYWGHSNGGEIGLRMAVITDKIKAYSLWAGVVGSYEDHLETFNNEIPFLDEPIEYELVQENSLPSQNPGFWSKIDPYYHLEKISAPIQLQHGTADSSVPVGLSIHLRDELQELGKEVEYFEYQGDDHNIGQNSSLAFRRAIDFFNENL